MIIIISVVQKFQKSTAPLQIHLNNDFRTQVLRFGYIVGRTLETEGSY